MGKTQIKAVWVQSITFSKAFFIEEFLNRWIGCSVKHRYPHFMKNPKRTF